MSDFDSELMDLKLTPLQREMWLGQKLNPDRPVYNSIFSFKIEGAIDVDTFAKAHQELIRVTDSMRIVFSETKGDLRQLISTKPIGALEYVDQSDAAEEDFQDLLLTEGRALLDLQSCPWRSILYSRTPNSFVWLFVHHHLLADGMSFQIVFRRLATIYSAFASGAGLPPSFAFPLFSKWAAGRASDPALANTSPDTLPAETAHSSLYSSHASKPGLSGKRISASLDADTISRINTLVYEEEFISFSKDLSVTLILLASTVALLARLNRKSTVNIGLVHHGRQNKEEREIAGPLVIVHTLTINIDARDTFASLYTKVQSCYLDRSRHALEGASDTNSSVKHDVMFSFYRNEINAFAGHPSEAEWLYSGCHESQHRWRIHFLAEGDSRLKLLSDFSIDSFSDSAMAQANRDLAKTIDTFAQDPSQEIWTYPLSRLNEKSASVLIGPKAPEIELHNLWLKFERVSENSEPDAVAIKSGENSITFKDLYAAATRLGDHLRSRTPKEIEQIPVITKRDAKAIEAYLAIMRAGKAFLPIESTLPQKRIDAIVDDSGCPFVIDENYKHNDIAPLHVTDFEGSDKAYVIHTSGTSGLSNGVCVRHRSVKILLNDMEQRAPLSPNANCLWWTAVSFDVSIYEIFSALNYGRTLCIPPEEIRLNSKKLFSWIQENRIESAYLPPFMLEDLNEWLPENPGFPLKRLLVGVEPIREDLLASIASKGNDLVIVNGYGPTETTICATFYTIDPKQAPRRRTPIGAPTFGNRCYVLDPHLNIVPREATGELYIAGAGVSLGYWNRAALQSKRFLPDPFYPDGDENVMYKTGDLVRIDEDGQLVFVGREDSQVKVRGQRIELGEIEQIVSLYKGVDRCAAAVKKLGKQDELICYYSGETALQEKDLLAFAAEHLPFQLQPKRFIYLKSFPMTVNGKLDNKALPEPTLLIEESKRELDTPTGPVQEHVYDVWSEALNAGNFSVHDSYFQLGGTSLTAMEITLQLCKDFDVDLPLQTIFQKSTVSELSDAIESKLEEEIGELSDEEAQELIDNS